MEGFSRDNVNLGFQISILKKQQFKVANLNKQINLVYLFYLDLGALLVILRSNISAVTANVFDDFIKNDTGRENTMENF